MSDTAQVNEFGQPIGARLPGGRPRPSRRRSRFTAASARCSRSPSPTLQPCGTPTNAMLMAATGPTSPMGPTAPFRAVRAVDRAVDRQPRPAVLRCERPRRVGGRRAGGRPRRRRGLPENHAGHGRHRGGSHPFLAAAAAHPAATEAMYLMMRRVFELGYRRYEWKCDTLNAPSRRAAQRLGFSYEGIFRQAIVTKGRNRDTAWYACIDQEWPALRRGLSALARAVELRRAGAAARVAVVADRPYSRRARIGAPAARGNDGRSAAAERGRARRRLGWRSPVPERLGPAAGERSRTAP